MKKIGLFFFICLMFINTSALTYGGCDYSTVARMKSIVSNVNISYDYQIIDNQVNFNVTLNNLTNDVYFYDTITKKNYYYSDTNNGEIIISNYTGTSGKYMFYSNNSSCKGVALGIKYYNFPTYNRYYNNKYCLEVPNYSLCQKWVKVNYSQQEFEKKILEYINKEEVVEEEIPIIYEKTFLDNIVEFYVQYYYIILGILILVCTTVIVVYNRKNRFDL